MSAPHPRASGPRRRVTTALSLVLALLLAPVVALGTAAPASAAVIRPFEKVFSVNTNGDVLLVGNTLMTCQDASLTCATTRAVVNGPAEANSNNNTNPQWVNVDPGMGSWTSSSADLQIPSGGAVLFAALVWGGRTPATSGTANADPALRGQARLKITTTSGTAVHSLTGARVDSPGTGHYASYIDVTSLVAAAGTGTYTVADVQSEAASGATDKYAGWSLVVAVADPSAPARNLTIFNGYGSVQSGDSVPTTFPVEGFLTPPSGPVRTTLGVVTFEGDMGLQGDTFRLNTTTISDARNAATNPWNSTITRRGANVTTRNPAYANQLGIDIDTFDADGILANSASSATISLTTSGDTYLPSFVTFATDLYDPKLLGTKTVTDLDGGDVEPGDVLEYRVPVENIGLDAASGSRFFDAIPTGTTYVPNSTVVDGVAQTDAAGDDRTRYVTTPKGHIETFLGAGATSTSGGVIPMSSGAAQHLVTFRVTVDADATHGQELTNAAVLTYRGQTTNASASSATNAVISPVVTAGLGGNFPPDATPHVLTFTPTPGARTVTIPVLADDTDPENDPLTVVGVTDAAGGDVTVHADGTLTYAPRDDVAGRDVFTYTIQDTAGNRSTAAVQVEVVNTAPVAGPDALSARGATATDVTATLLANDTDANGDALVVRSAGPASAQGGTVGVVGGVVTYTARPGFRGTDTFTYVVEDARGGRDTGTATVTVTNNAPVAVADAYATPTGTTVAVAVLGNDTDLDGDPLAAQLVSGPANGSLTLNANGTGSYTPLPGYAGTDSFTYRTVDGQGGTSGVATVTLTVDGRPVAVDDARATTHLVPVDVPVLANDTDPEDGALTVTGVTTPAHGTAVVGAGGVVTYTPAAGWAGVDTFDYTVSDGRSTDTGTVTVTTANAAPVAHPDAVSTATDTTVTGVDVLGNDTDVNVAAGVPGQALAVTGATADHGATVTVAPDGTLEVTPATGFSGTVTVTYALADGAGGTADGTLTVTVLNGAPTAAPDGPVTTPTDTPVLVDVLANDTDPNPADTLVVAPGSLTAPVDGAGDVRGAVAIEAGQVRYTPPTGWSGTVTFTYEVADGQGGTVTGTAVVVVANAAPVAVDDAASTPTGTAVTVDVLADDTDANIPGTDQELRVTAATADRGATVVVNPDGALTVTPAAGSKGVVTVTYTVTDGAGGTDDGVLRVTVGNAAPVARPDTATTPYATPVAVDLLDDDTDANGDTLTVVPGSVTTPVDAGGTPRGAVTVVGGVATYTPPAGFSGVVTFRYTATDGTDRSDATVTVTVGNAPPAPAPDRATTPAGSPVVIDVVGNDADDDGGTLTIVSVTQPTSGTVAIVDNRLVYTPAPGFTGTVSFEYTVSDGQGGLSTATVQLEVSAAAPAAGGSGGTGTAGSGASGTLARTGAEVGGAVALAALLVAAGLALVVVRRRRVA